jgi:hypothetical protein
MLILDRLLEAMGEGGNTETTEGGNTETTEITGYHRERRGKQHRD